MTDDSDVELLEQRRDRLVKWISRVLPDARSVALSPFVPASSGFSNVTAFTDLTWEGPGGTRRIELVLRAQTAEGGLFPDYDLRLQYDVMAALNGTAVPVPEVIWYIDDPEVLGVPGYLMRRVDGKVASGFRPGFHGHGLFFEATLDRRRAMWFAAVDVMADLHLLRPDELALPAQLDHHLTGEASVRRILDVIESRLNRVGVQVPILDEALRLLRSRIPSGLRVSLCWGDARPGNIIYRNGRVAAVLDWELAHIGPPEGDLAYFLLVDEVVAELNGVQRLTGLPDPGETIAHYARRTDAPITDLQFHRAVQGLRMAAMLALTVQLSPPQLQFPPNYLCDNVATRRLAELLR